jgi:hypothetical protein
MDVVVRFSMNVVVRFSMNVVLRFSSFVRFRHTISPNIDLDSPEV